VPRRPPTIRAPGQGSITERRREYREFRGGSAERGYGARWRKAAKEFLAFNPLCRTCSQLATRVDHIVPHRGDQRLFWDRRNWQPLCESCHNRKTALENSLGRR
jgi:5-methylcytosine-specific restriction protein A